MNTGQSPCQHFRTLGSFTHIMSSNKNAQNNDLHPTAGVYGLRNDLPNYGDSGFSIFLRKAFIKAAGYSEDALNQPIVGIIDTSSGFNPCHGNVPKLVKAVERGVLLSGALPIPFPTISIHESFSTPTSMYLRNLMSLDTEEMIRGQPLDAVVLIGGCDKTVPAQLMGAISANIRAVQLVSGPMLTGSHGGVRVGACTDCRRYWKAYRAEEIEMEEIWRVNDELAPTHGTCGVMGTASTMACITEALCLMPLGSATPPAVTSARERVAEKTGRIAAHMATTKAENVKLQNLLTKKHFENAVRILQALGGSTNAVVHLMAIAGRLPELEFGLDDFDRIGRDTPLLVNLKPAGTQYMEDFHRSGGLPILLRELSHLLHLDVLTITGKTLREELQIHKFNSKDAFGVVQPFNAPVFPKNAIVVLHGNLAPKGCVMKQAAAPSELRKHTGKAVVFENTKDLSERIDSDDLDVTPESVLVLKNIGLVGNPGMPEAGLIPIPRKLALAGVKDILRISDGRMSGTAEGAVVLHVSPEAALGGPLAVIQNGDPISVNAEQRSINIEISQEELDGRIKAWQEAKARQPVKFERGYAALYKNTLTSADLGGDFDWARADGGKGVRSGPA